ncbi:sensor of ECF-type sigma factor [Flavobacterium faecale]|uniref:sensor of ECF-type sigma factor n=1 Tax=Flavobacterium faecale TaxID=1355330 RepID=UPI003AAAE428
MKFKSLFFLFLAFTVSSYSQESIKEKRDQIRALKVSFFNSELDLSPSESDRFWPLYNVFDDKQFEIRHQKVRTYRNLMKDHTLNKMSEKEAGELLAQIESTDEELYQLRKNLNANLKKFLPKVKIIKLKKAEEDFNRKLLQQYKDKKGKN